MRINSLCKLAGVLFVPSFLGAQTNSQSASPKPNIIFILCDDMGYGDLACYGQPYIQTPCIDQMAQEGMRFTQAYAGSPVSAPSRASLMTGQHTGHGHVRGNKEYWTNVPKVKYGTNDDFSRVGQEPYDINHIILPEIMKRNGYTTGLFGKWAGGYEGSCSTPDKRGVDTFYGYICQFQAHLYYPNFLNRYYPTMGDTAVVRIPLTDNIPYPMFGDDYKKRTQYSADMIHHEALAWIDKQDTNKPFCGFFTYTLPHAELAQPNDSILKQYKKKFYTDKTWGGQEGSRYNAVEHTHAEFAGMITRLDKYVGEIFAKLKEKGLDQNTLVVFTSDNGPHEEGGADPAFFGRDGKLQGLKRQCYEGGIRVPFIVRWPGKVPAGKVNDHQLAFYDVMPTFCELIGDNNFPKKYLSKKLKNDCFDGISFAPTLFGNEAAQQKHDYLYWEFHETDQIAVRQGDWKLVVVRGVPRLYNLATDIHEDHDLARKYPDKVSEMVKLIKKEHRESDLFKVTIPQAEFTTEYAGSATSKTCGKPIFSEEFNTSNNGLPDTTIWASCKPFQVAWAQHFKNCAPYENVRIEDGVLKLKASKVDGKYKTAGIQTRFGFPVNTRVEVRAKFDKQVRGAFPAIWQMPIGAPEWPRGGEVDIMEWVQSDPDMVFQTVHSHYNNMVSGTTGTTNPKNVHQFDITQYHVYAAERTDDAVIFYLDGKETWRYNNMHLPKDKTQFPYADYPYNIILNYSLGGELNGGPTWAGKISDEDLPGELWIDWVHVLPLKKSVTTK